MPTSMEALKILAGGPGYSRRLPTEAFGFGGRTPTQGELESPFELEQADMAARADAADRAATAKILATNAAVAEHNRPDVTAIREEEDADALRKLILPIRVKGEYDVQAAREHAAANAANTQALIGGRERVANINQAGTTARTAAGLKSQALRQRYQAVATGKEKAPGTGFFGQFTGGNEAAKQKLLADIQAQIDAADLEDASSAPTEGGAPVVAPGGGDKAARMAALRAAMGR